MDDKHERDYFQLSNVLYLLCIQYNYMDWAQLASSYS